MTQDAMRDTTAWTPATLDGFRLATQEAAAQGLEVFAFDGREYLVPYAEYLIEQVEVSFGRGRTRVEASDLQRQLAEAAERGDAEAQFALACRYRTDHESPKDLARAVQWYRKAAQAGHIGAMSDLGSMLMNGLGVPADAVTAADWFERAAQAGDLKAKSSLALCYLRGMGRERRPDITAPLLMDAAMMGRLEPAGVRELGTLFLKGDGVPQDYQTAAEFHQLAGMNGDVASAEQLASYLPEIVKLALGGSQVASFVLGKIFDKGTGVERDRALAMAWFRWALNNCAPVEDQMDELRSCSSFYCALEMDAVKREADLRYAEIVSRSEASI